MSLANLEESLFNCNSLETTDPTANVSQIHIIESINGTRRSLTLPIAKKYYGLVL
jgi:hypothetical protein